MFQTNTNIKKQSYGELMCFSNMEQDNNEEDFYLLVEKLIKSGNLKDALAEVEVQYC